MGPNPKAFLLKECSIKTQMHGEKAMSKGKDRDDASINQETTKIASYPQMPKERVKMGFLTAVSRTNLVLA